MTAPCPTFGFRVMLDVRARLAPALANALREAWSELLGSRGLTSRGGGAERLTYIVTSEASQATESDRLAIQTWIASRPELVTRKVAALEDLGGDA
jgi:hypothetical protein